MSEQFSSGMINSTQTNKQYIHILDYVISIKSVHKSKWGLHKTANSGQNVLIDGFITFK